MPALLRRLNPGLVAALRRRPYSLDRLDHPNRTTENMAINKPAAKPNENHYE
jgi:hypothetical protein